MQISLIGNASILIESRGIRILMENIHRELMVMLVPRETPLKSRFGDQARWAYRLKRAIKGLLRQLTRDLYDLGTWTLWEESSAKP